MTHDLAATPIPGRDGTLAAFLDGAPPALLFPTDRPRPDVLGSTVSSVRTTLDGGLVAALHALGERRHADLYAVLLSAWRVLLSRTADERDLVVGCGDAATGTHRDELVVVRAPVALDEGFGSAVASTARALALGAERARGTVEELVAELGVEPGSGKHPIFQVGFVRLADGEQPTWPEHRAVPPDLVLGWWHGGDDVGLRLDHAAELFDRWRVERLSSHLVRLLTEAVADPERPVGSLPLLGREELAELDAWNRTAHPHDPERPLAARFWEQVRRTPDAPALEMHGEVLSYEQLAGRAARLARALRSEGVDSDVTVAVCAERSVEMAVAVLAVLMAGGAYVPVDPGYPAGRRELMIRDSGARVLLTQAALRSAVPTGFDGQVLLLDAPLPDEAPQTAEQETAGRSGRDLGYVVYTSGSTGQPKGVAMPQSALDNLVAWQLRRPQFAPGARTLQFSSLSFDVSFQELFTTWCSGGTLVLVDDATRRDPLRLLDHLVAHRVTRLFLPYVALRGLASAVASTGVVPADLREVYTAGEQLRIDPVVRALFGRLPGCVLENQYGPSESHVVTAHTLGDDPARWPVLPPVGSPVANSQAHVLDSRLERRPVGVPGELYLGGACLARGYLGRPDLTAERFVPAPTWAQGSERLYRTGDLARWLPSGELEFLGRLDHQVKFRGYRIEPGEVGAVLSGAPGVEQCVAVVREGDGGARLTAYLVPDGDAEPEVGVVHRYARENLPGYMVPSHYLVLPALPLTASGKIDTASLPDAPFDRGILSTAFRPPSTHEEQVLAEIWSTLLGVPDVGVLDDFYELGGDSLLAAEMVQRVAVQLGREMPLGALAQAPTIAALAALLRGDQEGSLWRSLVPLQAGDDDTTPLFVVHGGSGNVATFPRLARALPPEQPVYGLQWDGLDGSRGRRTIEAMAAHYLDEVRSVQPHGPYLLAGQCVGGLVAREMARLLLEQGEQVDLLVMYDSPHLRSEAYVPGRRVPLRERAARYDSLGVALLAGALEVYRRRPTRDPVKRGTRAMRAAVWRHRPAPLPEPVPTLYVGSGESDARRIALDGHWTDGAMGWASSASDQFRIHRVEDEHNEIMYHPEAVALLLDALERARGRRVPA